MERIGYINVGMPINTPNELLTDQGGNFRGRYCEGRSTNVNFFTCCCANNSDGNSTERTIEQKKNTTSDKVCLSLNTSQIELLKKTCTDNALKHFIHLDKNIKNMDFCWNNLCKEPVYSHKQAGHHTNSFTTIMAALLNLEKRHDDPLSIAILNKKPASDYDLSFRHWCDSRVFKWFEAADKQIQEKALDEMHIFFDRCTQALIHNNPTLLEDQRAINAQRTGENASFQGIDPQILAQLPDVQETAV